MERVCAFNADGVTAQMHQMTKLNNKQMKTRLCEK